MANGEFGLRHDTASMELADDLVSIDHYRVAIRVGGNGGKIERYVSVGEIDPHCDDLVSDDIAKYSTPEEAELSRDQFVSINRAIGIPTDAVVVGMNTAGVVLAIDGEAVELPDDGSTIPF